MSENELQQLLDKQQIRATLERFCRAVDRMDNEAFAALWHEDAEIIYHGVFEGGWEQFRDWVMQMCHAMQSHSHQLGNMLIEVDGEEAASEAYVSVTLLGQPADDGTVSEIQLRGRYLDRWQNEQGVWKILRHELVTDIQSVYAPQSAETSDASERSRKDLSYGYLSS